MPDSRKRFNDFKSIIEHLNNMENFKGLKFFIYSAKLWTLWVTEKG